MKVLRNLVVLLGLPCALCLPAAADQFYLTARMDCRPAKAELRADGIRATS